MHNAEKPNPPASVRDTGGQGGLSASSNTRARNSLRAVAPHSAPSGGVHGEGIERYRIQCPSLALQAGEPGSPPNRLWLRPWGFLTVSPSHRNTLPHHQIRQISVEFAEDSPFTDRCSRATGHYSRTCATRHYLPSPSPAGYCLTPKSRIGKTERDPISASTPPIFSMSQNQAISSDKSIRFSRSPLPARSPFALAAGGAQRQGLQTCQPDGHQPQCLLSSCSSYYRFAKNLTPPVPGLLDFLWPSAPKVLSFAQRSLTPRNSKQL